MRVLVVHNAYRHQGGEDAVVDAEIDLLRARNNAVEVFRRHNDEINTSPTTSVALGTIWSQTTIRYLAQRVKEFEPDVAHIHNTFPLISPSVYWGLAARRVPVVQTLHNFRLLCLQAMFLRDGQICEDCLGRLPWRGVVHHCYRSSMVQSSVAFSMLAAHRSIGTYRDKVARYIALNEFCRGKFIEGGLPERSIVVKPNFVEPLGISPEGLERRGFLFVGRLSPEKGIAVLAGAAARIGNAQVKVLGTGPEAGTLEGLGNVENLGFLGIDGVISAMQQAECLILPSLWYENFPRTLVEAFACGLPVVASRLGALAELVRDGETGILFEPGNAADLAAKMRWALEHPAAMRRMGEAARREYEAKYTPDINYGRLMTIYQEAIEEVKSAG